MAHHQATIFIWAQVGLDPDGAPDHLSFSPSFSLSLSALGWSFLRSDLTLSMPVTLHPQRLREELGIESSGEIVPTCVHLNGCDLYNAMEIR